MQIYQKSNINQVYLCRCVLGALREKILTIRYIFEYTKKKSEMAHRTRTEEEEQQKYNWRQIDWQLHGK